jgi:hypothetical protein
VGGVMSYVPHALVMPLALFTLDSSSWETRQHAAAPGVAVVAADERAA